MKVFGVEVQPSEAEKERVLDVPAIVMTEASGDASQNTSDATSSKPEARNARASKASSRQGRAKTRRRPASKAATAPPPERRAGQAAAPAESPKRSRDGSVGRETFAAVEALVKRGMTKSQAFRQIAADTDKNSGTVAAAYYRVSRSNRSAKPRPGSAKQAVTPRARRQGASRRVVRGRTDGTGQGVDQIVGRLVANLQALTEAVKAQDADVKELRGRLDGVHSLLNS